MENSSQAPSQPNTQPLSGVPDTWPGAWGVYKYSKQAVMMNLGTLVLLFLISFASGLLGIIPVLGTIASYAVGVLTSVATALVMLAGVNGTKMSVGESLKASFTMRSVKYLFNMILLMLILLGSLLLFIVPFFFIFPRVILAPYFVALDNMGPVDALGASWEATKGHVSKVYGISGVALIFALLCLVLVGIYFSIMYSAVVVVLFAYLKLHATAAPVAAPATAPTPGAPAA